MTNNKKRIILAVTGASGMPYALHLARALAQAPGVEGHIMISAAARKVMALELDQGPDALDGLDLVFHEEDDIAAPPASGSWLHSGMIVCPCSMATLGAIAGGLGDNLIHRAADVTLKENRPLVLVARETPLSTIHLENMLRARRAGATVMPACPGFYSRPRDLDDLAAQMAGRVLDQLGPGVFPDTGAVRRWGS